MAQTQSIEFFFVATLQKSTSRGMSIQTIHGTVTWPKPDATRMDLLTWFLSTYIPNQIPDMAGASIVFWQCEPDAYAVPTIQESEPELEIWPHG